MTIIPLTSIYQSLFLPFPESLNLGCCLVLSSHMRTPCSLNTTGHSVPVLVSLAFQVEESFWIFDECLGHSHLPFITGDFGVRQDPLTT
jgi:hypothetical protein